MGGAFHELSVMSREPGFARHLPLRLVYSIVRAEDVAAHAGPQDAFGELASRTLRQAMPGTCLSGAWNRDPRLFEDVLNTRRRAGAGLTG